MHGFPNRTSASIVIRSRSESWAAGICVSLRPLCTGNGELLGLYGLLAFLDPLLSRAPLVVEAHHGPVECGRGQIIRRFRPASKRECGITNQAVSKLFCPTPAKIRIFRLRWTHQLYGFG